MKILEMNGDDPMLTETDKLLLTHPGLNERIKNAQAVASYDGADAAIDGLRQMIEESRQEKPATK